jgi:phage-related protein
MLHFSETLIIFVLNKNQRVRTIIFWKHHFEEFFIKQNQKVKDKIIWTFDLIETIQRIPENILKHIEGSNGLYEIRVQAEGNNFRIFCFFDKNKLIVLANGFQKKTQKTPMVEIKKALTIKVNYEKENKQTDHS